MNINDRKEEKKARAKAGEEGVPSLTGSQK
jgi:hypothetical protein